MRAALTLVVDLGQRLGSDSPVCSRLRVVDLMRIILFSAGGEYAAVNPAWSAETARKLL
ncbi:hypothetical protein AB4305_15215 [Nocardia sp. 2YAB30]|uniref:hypothetical protein n=1 Tax=unclassified Nocardia TaxID=2637762 RepID=UPI003F9C0CEF